ncbi:MAG: hypothetical protein SW833_17220 [Cyanobacteriota bacterium]|nr:hypothetical protein [Cyanobacteriota bacterium]
MGIAVKKLQSGELIQIDNAHHKLSVGKATLTEARSPKLITALATLHYCAKLVLNSDK